MDSNSIKKMYFDEGKSAKEIGIYYKKTEWQIYKFMKRHGFARRSAAETLHLKFLRSPLTFNFKGKLSPSELELWQAGLTLYWAEGSKAGRFVVDFANSDEKMLAIFLRVLRQIYRVQESKLRIFLYCYLNQNPSELINHWSEKLGVAKNQFTKPYIRSDFKVEKLNKMKHGLVHIRYADMRLMEKIKKDIDKIADKLINRRDTQVVNEVGL